VFALLFATTSPSAELLRPVRTAAAAPLRAASAKSLPPIVMVFFDEFPLQSLLDSSGQIDRRVYPNFADFAAHSTWYRNATGVSGFTPYALPAMLTGRYPSTVVAPILQNFPKNLFTLFGSSYNLKVSETITQLCPPVRCGVTAGSRDDSGLGAVLKDSAGLYRDVVSPYDTPVNPASFADTQTAAAEAGGKGGKKLDTKDPQALFKSNLGNAELNAPSRFTDFLGSIKAGDPQPTLYFLHILLPHTPWRFEPDGALYNQGSLPFLLSLPEEQWPKQYVELTHERHLLQLAYTDRLVGDLIKRLKDQGLYDKALVLLTADHGNGFATGERARRLGPTNAPSLMWVPLFVKVPRQAAGRVDDRNWEQVDLLPTLADMAGIRVPWKMDGVSQAGPPARTRTDKYWYDHPGHRQTRDGPSNWASVLKGVTDSLVQAHQHGDPGFYQYGWFADWVYKPPRAVGQVTAGPSAKATIRNWKLFETIDPMAATVPALVVGQLTTPPPPARTTVLVAVNGRVGGASLLYADHAGQPASKFAVVVPDFLYRKGSGQSQVQVYLVRNQGPHARGRRLLQPVALSG
jgi:Sulfatase